jgi:hypothetical protein
MPFDSNTRVKVTFPELPEVTLLQARVSPAAASGVLFSDTIPSDKRRQSSSVSIAVFGFHPKRSIWAMQGSDTSNSNATAVTDCNNRRRPVIWSPQQSKDQPALWCFRRSCATWKNGVQSHRPAIVAGMPRRGKPHGTRRLPDMAAVMRIKGAAIKRADVRHHPPPGGEPRSGLTRETVP